MHKRAASGTAPSIPGPVGARTHAASEGGSGFLFPEFDRFVTLHLNGIVPPQWVLDHRRDGLAGRS
jgi:hypothetical protein